MSKWVEQELSSLLVFGPGGSSGGALRIASCLGLGILRLESSYVLLLLIGIFNYAELVIICYSRHIISSSPPSDPMR